MPNPVVKANIALRAILSNAITVTVWAKQQGTISFIKIKRKLPIVPYNQFKISISFVNRVLFLTITNFSYFRLFNNINMASCERINIVCF